MGKIVFLIYISLISWVVFIALYPSIVSIRLVFPIACIWTFGTIVLSILKVITKE
jgi:hypothetical protein